MELPAAAERGFSFADPLAIGLVFCGLAVFAVNRSGAEDVELTLSVDDAVITEVRGVDVLSGTDPKAVNDWEHPRRVVPQAGNARLAEGKAALKVPRYGFVALRAATRPR